MKTGFIRDKNNSMGFGTYFRAFSYAMIAVAMLALVLAGRT